MLDESRDGVAKKIFGEHFCLVRERFAGKLIPCRSFSSRARPPLRATKVIYCEKVWAHREDLAKFGEVRPMLVPFNLK